MSQGRGVILSWDFDGNAAKRIVVDAIPKIKPSGSFRGLEHRKLHAIGTAATVLSIFPIGRAAILIRHITPLPVVMLQSITAVMAVCHILAVDRAAASTGGATPDRPDNRVRF